MTGDADSAPSIRPDALALSALERRAVMAQILDAACPGLGHLYAGARRSGAIFLAIIVGCLAILGANGWRFLRVLFAERVVHLPSLLWTVALLGYALAFTILVVTDASSFRQADRPAITRLERIAASSGVLLLLFLWGAF